MGNDIDESGPIARPQKGVDNLTSSDLVVLRDVWDALVRARWGIASVVVIAILVALVIAFSLPSIYRASATVVVESNISRPIENIPDLYNPGAGRPEYYYTQFGIIKSRAVVKQVVDTLKLVDNPVFADVVKPPTDHDWRKWLPFLPASDSMPQSAQQEQADKRERLIAYIRSHLLHVTISPGSQLVKVSVDSRNPELAAKMTNAVVSAYIDVGLDARLQTAKRFSGWLAARLQTTGKALADSQAALQSFKVKEHLVDLKNVGGALQTQLQSNMSQLYQAQLEMTELGSAYHKIKQAGSDPRKLESISTLLTDPTVRAAKNSMLEAQQQVETLSSRYGPKYPTRISAQTALDAARQAYYQQLMTAAAGVRAKYEVAERTASSLGQTAKQTQGRLQNLGGQSYKLSVLQRNVQANQDLYDNLLQRAKQTGMMGQFHAVLARPLDRATVPYVPAKPHKKFIVVIGAAIGVLVGIALALLRYFLVDVIRSTDDLEQCSNLSVLGALPLVRKERSTKVEYKDHRLAGFIEGIRSIRTSLALSDMTARKKILLVTSSNAAEGKTTTALNLAVACAQMERVLLVDTDFRRPVLAARLGLKNKNGLAELLSGQGEKDECITHYEEGGIDVLSMARPPSNAAEIAGSPQLAALIRRLSADYDRVILDSPPCLAVSDALMLSRVCHAVLLVVKVEHTRRRAIQHTVRQLQSAHANVLGVIANQIDKSHEKYYSYGDYSYYGAGYGAGTSRESSELYRDAVRKGSYSDYGAGSSGT